MAFVENYKFEEELDQEENVEIAVAKMAIDKPHVCQALKPARVKEKFKETIKAKDTQVYSFDINRIRSSIYS